MFCGLGPSDEVRRDVETAVNYPTTKGTGFLDIVKFVLTPLCVLLLY